MTRIFAAPREAVWEAMMNPKHVPNWYGYRDSTMPVCDMDVRVGGRWRYVSRTADGREVEFYGVYREIVRPERAVYTEIFAPFPEVESVVTVVLTEEEGITHYSSTAWYPAKEIRDAVLATGMEKGAAISLDRLAEVAERLG